MAFWGYSEDVLGNDLGMFWGHSGHVLGIFWECFLECSGTRLEALISPPMVGDGRHANPG